MILGISIFLFCCCFRIVIMLIYKTGGTWRLGVTLSNMSLQQLGLSTPFGISNASFKSKYRIEILYTVLCRISSNYYHLEISQIPVCHKTMIDPCKNLRLFAMSTYSYLQFCRDVNEFIPTRKIMIPMMTWQHFLSSQFI